MSFVQLPFQIINLNRSIAETKVFLVSNTTPLFLSKVDDYVI